MKKIIVNLCIMLCCMMTMSLMAQDRQETATTETTSQASAPISRYEQEAIVLKRTFWKNGYVKNGVFYSLGFMGNNLKKEFENYPAAMEEFKLHQKKTRIILGVSSVGIITAIAALLHYSKRVGPNSSGDEPPTKGESVAYIGGVGGALCTTVWGANSTFNHLHQAIYLRNKAICEGK